MKYIKIYIQAVKDSYAFMEGLRGVRFWVTLPFKAFKITYWNIQDMCGPDCKNKQHIKIL